MAYDYKMMQIPPDVTVKMKEQRGNEAAPYLESIARQRMAMNFIVLMKLVFWQGQGALARCLERKQNILSIMW